MPLPHALPSFTSREYLSLERLSETRHEYLDGLVYPLAGESLSHSTICFNLMGIIGTQLRGTPRRGFSPNMKVRAGEAGLYAYPDLAVACGEPAFEDKHGDVLLNPTVIFEVLSRSTEAYDRGEKFERYKKVGTLRDYVLVSQDRPRLERFSRQPDGTWSKSEVTGTDSTLMLDTTNCRIPLAEIYERITFSGE